ncbi:ergothioneine biosynthesis protein EgtB [Thermoleophilum album]|uniref:ergothioneine biosynthesis protein EgtB n=1 Tax=Thermoleophilum album TaxID=29539 RepID=UPI00237D052B|nr:ergothioneine biosynthesis protein EgtB [Thermoleophilum album]WDT94031.1 ergothioneine biosynthesis protein EgtB [Thermoleophilum album]
MQRTANVHTDTPPAPATVAGAAAVELPSSARQLERLTSVRERTLALVERVDERALDRVFTPILSPIAWDLGHIAAFEDLWIAERLGGMSPLYPELRPTYDAIATPRAARAKAPHLRARDALAYLAAVRERTQAVLSRCEHEEASFFAELVARHEQQHLETVLQALKIAPAGVFEPPPDDGPVPPAAADAPQAARGETIAIAGGRYRIGAERDGFAYDNERPAHIVELGAFAIDRRPVTNREFAEFVADGGYHNPALWSREGWAVRRREGWERPLYWTADGGEIWFGREVERAPDAPVAHISFYEAEAFARWAGKRLPTEYEWEVAATHVPGSSTNGAAAERTLTNASWARRHAVCDLRSFRPLAVDATRAASPCGAQALIGDVWEWTASEFDGYPGFRAYPYREYSETHFRRGYRVLRGGSWATQAEIATATFRNWDLPQRRQIFAGVRCAIDLPED